VPPVARAGGPERDVVEAEGLAPAAVHAQGEVETGRYDGRATIRGPAARVSIRAAACGDWGERMTRGLGKAMEVGIGWRATKSPNYPAG
jgi:hypothetical protein